MKKEKKTKKNKGILRMTVKIEKFCEYVVETGNQSEAYRRAFSVKSMTDKSIWEKASALMADTKVRSRVEEIKKRMADKSDITKERILKELSCIAFADIRDFLTITKGCVKFKDSNKWTEDMARAVESVKMTKEGIEIKLNGKSWSITRICAMLGYDTPTVVDLRNSLLKIDTGVD